MNNNDGERFQNSTKYSRQSLGGGGLDWSKKPETYKEYPESEKIQLPSFESTQEENFSAVIQKRRSIRDYSDELLSLTELSYLLRATQGITAKISGYEFRASPSAGALYPVETYLLINKVEKVDSGIYHYGVKNHCLELLKKGDFAEEAASGALGQDMVACAQVAFIWTAVFERSKWKYRQRAYRYVYLDAGHIAAHLSLAAVSLGLGSCQIAAFFDDEINALVGVDGQDESVIYMSVAGKPLSGRR